MAQFVRDLQGRIVHQLQQIENSMMLGGDGTDTASPSSSSSSSSSSAQFLHDKWTKTGGLGEGMSCVLQGGLAFEKAAVNVSVVEGPLSKQAAMQMRTERGKTSLPTGDEYEKNTPHFFATGVSLIVHPVNPHVPTVHANYRYFEIELAGGNHDNDDARGLWWFGGGCDLTPYFLYEDDAQHFHTVHREACDKHDKALYPRFKKWCDEYFYLPHRGETRGVGGLFFDDLDESHGDQESLFAFVQSCGNVFLDSYVPIVTKRLHTPFTEEHTRWQQIRRGRYVEFNLLHDRGTKFGLAAPEPRVESILASLPLTARWEYNYQVDESSEEGKLMKVLREPREWAK